MYDITQEMTIQEKLEILSDAAKYDVACTSSGVDRAGKKGHLGNSVSAGICHAFAADGRCISLLKILMSNECVYDCSYCKSRRSSDILRATFTPEEISELTVEFYKRNYIEGLFLSSGVLKNPDHTMELMCRTVRLLRTEYHFNGYIHMKAIPGASRELIYSAGLLADRISINMELPTQSSLRELAPNKTMTTIIKPMNQISQTISDHRVAIGKSARMERAVINRHLVNSIWGPEDSRPGFADRKIEGAAYRSIGRSADGQMSHQSAKETAFFKSPQQAEAERVREYLNGTDTLLYPAERMDKLLRRPFAPAGQSTQMIIGATGETDLELIRTTQGLYQGFDLKRVFYSGYIPLNEDPRLPSIGTPVPLLREHRLYQADFLMRYYGFLANELLSEEKPFFDEQIDPKCFWALQHLDQFPVEINSAPADLLLRIPGIGPTGVKRILSARRFGSVNFEMLRKMRIVLKRAQYFITCNGKMLYHIPIEERFIRNQLTSVEEKAVSLLMEEQTTGRQMNLFSDFGMAVR